MTLPSSRNSSDVRPLHESARDSQRFELLLEAPGRIWSCCCPLGFKVPTGHNQKTALPFRPFCEGQIAMPCQPPVFHRWHPLSLSPRWHFRTTPTRNFASEAIAPGAPGAPQGAPGALPHLLAPTPSGGNIVAPWQEGIPGAPPGSQWRFSPGK